MRFAWQRFQSVDDLSAGKTWLHMVDARAKLLLVLVYAILLMSAGPFQWQPVLLMGAVPVFLLAASGLPVFPILLRLGLSLPFVLSIAVWTPFVMPEGTPGYLGWVALTVVLLKTLLSVLMVLLLVATTPVPRLTNGARRLGLPVIFLNVIQFIYRFLALMLGEAGTMMRARDLRAAGGHRGQSRSALSMMRTLLIRASVRSGRVARSMYSRGYAGRLVVLDRLAFRPVDGVLFAVGLVVIILLRFYSHFWGGLS